MEELQCKEQSSSLKGKKKKLEIPMLDNFAEADDNSKESCKEETESNDYKSDNDSEGEDEMQGSVKEEDNEEMKQELEDNMELTDPNIKVEKEEDTENIDNNTNNQDDQEQIWHNNEDDDDIIEGDKRIMDSQEVLVKPDISDDVPALGVAQKFVQPKVKKEQKEQEYKKSSLCTECGKTFVNVRSLADHVKIAHTQTNFPCSECGEEQRNSMVLRQHLQKRHHLTTNEAKDLVSNLDLNELEETPRHNVTSMDIATPIDTTTPVNCETCIEEGKPKKIYKNRSHLQNHFTNWHDFGTYLCDTCGESFELKGQLRNHNNAKHSRKSQSKGGACPHCGKVVKNVSGHISEVHGPKKGYVCPVCARILNTFKQMRDHVRANHNNEGKVFICHICSKELGNELNLKQHLRRQHYKTPAPEDYVTCNECGKQFATEYRLKSHCKAVHESDPTNCDICGGNYKNKYSLSKHMKNAHDGHLSRSKVGKGSYRMPDPYPTIASAEDKSPQETMVGHPFVSP